MNSLNITENQISINNHLLYVKQIKSVLENERKAVLVFLHDSWGCTEMWGDFPEKLATISGLNALVYDRRGYGKSSPFVITKRTNRYLHDEAEELICLLDALKIKRAVLYGHSDGATIALIAAALFPKRVDGLILEGAHSFVEEICVEKVRKSRDKAKQNNLLKSLEKYHGNRVDELFRLWHETWTSDEFSNWSIVPLLRDIQVPTLSFQGENDEFGTIEQLRIIEKEIPAQVITAEIPNAGHTPRRENEMKSMMWIKKYFSTFADNFNQS